MLTLDSETRSAAILASRRQDPPVTFAQLGRDYGISAHRVRDLFKAAERREASDVERHAAGFGAMSRQAWAALRCSRLGSIPALKACATDGDLVGALMNAPTLSKWHLAELVLVLVTAA